MREQLEALERKWRANADSRDRGGKTFSGGAMRDFADDLRQVLDGCAGQVVAVAQLTTYEDTHSFSARMHDVVHSLPPGTYDLFIHPPAVEALKQELAAAREALQASEVDAGRVFERAYASGYRAALQAASAECRRNGEALDFSGNPYVRYADAIKCAAAIENMYVPAIDATLQRDRPPLRELIARAITNAAPKSKRWRYPLWVYVRNLFGLGSGYAAGLCRDLGFNPDAMNRNELRKKP